MNEDKTCRACNEKLQDKGIYPSRIKKYDWICIECSKGLNRHYHYKKAKKRQKDQTDDAK